MVGLGVGIDYALFIVTRYRENLDAGLDPERSVVHAVDTAGRAVLFAGSTVIISVLGLLAHEDVDHARRRPSRSRPACSPRCSRRSRCSPRCSGSSGATSTSGRSVAHKRTGTTSRQSGWYRWSRVIQRHPWPAADHRVRRSSSCSPCRCCRCGSGSTTPGTGPRATPRAAPTTSCPRASGRASTARCCSPRPRRDGEQDVAALQQAERHA